MLGSDVFVYQLGAASHLASLLYDSLLRSAVSFESGTKVLCHCVMYPFSWVMFTTDSLTALLATVPECMLFSLAKSTCIRTYMYKYTPHTLYYSLCSEVVHVLQFRLKLKFG